MEPPFPPLKNGRRQTVWKPVRRDTESRLGWGFLASRSPDFGVETTQNNKKTQRSLMYNAVTSQALGKSHKAQSFHFSGKQFPRFHHRNFKYPQESKTSMGWEGASSVQTHGSKHTSRWPTAGRSFCKLWIPSTLHHGQLFSTVLLSIYYVLSKAISSNLNSNTTKSGTAIGFTQWGNWGTEPEAFLPADRSVGVWLEFELRTQFLHYQHGRTVCM